MSALNEISFTEAEHTFAVANTPLYLIRKLRQDLTIYEISRSFSGDQILAELDSALRVKPASLADYVRPFVCLVALWHKPEDKYLKMSPQIPNATEGDWYNYVRRVLIETYSPTINLRVQAPPRAQLSRPSVHTDAPFTFHQVDVRRG
jgi:hypothetical protein